MNNVEFTFLTEEQVEQLEVLKNYGTEAAITDFSILLGGYVSSNHYTSEGNSRKDRTGGWWTKTPYNNNARVVNDYGDRDWYDVVIRSDGARPALPYSSISQIAGSGVSGANGILEVEYGEYPQYVVSEEFSKTLELAYSKRIINQTDKKYTTDSVYWKDYDTPFKARTHIEYEYNGKKYIRFVADSSCKGQILSDGRTVEEGKPYWVEVSPIKWMVDEKANIALSKYLIFSGVQFNNKSNYTGDFEHTDIYEFIQKYFSKEIVPSNIVKRKTSTFGGKALEEEQEDSTLERLRRNVEDGFSTMLWGLSGIGKTARVKQIDPTYTEIKLKNNMLPEEVVGGKEPNGNPGELYPPNWYKKLCEKCKNEPERMHILFIDEITNVDNTVKSLVWEIIENRRVNGNEDWVLPENCSIVAAGNRPEESTSVEQDYKGGVLPAPLHDRFDFHIEIKLDMEEWKKWALETNPKTKHLNIHPAVFSYCVTSYAKMGEAIMFSEMDVDNISKPRLSPRRWEKLSNILYASEKRGARTSTKRIEECIGKEMAGAFIAYYQKMPLDMEKVEKGLYKPEDFENIDDKLYAISYLIERYEGSELALEDFIITCLGEDALVIYKTMREQRNKVIEEKEESKKTL